MRTMGQKWLPLSETGNLFIGPDGPVHDTFCEEDCHFCLFCGDLYIMNIDAVRVHYHLIGQISGMELQFIDIIHGLNKHVLETLGSFITLKFIDSFDSCVFFIFIDFKINMIRIALRLFFFRFYEKNCKQKALFDGHIEKGFF